MNQPEASPSNNADDGRGLSEGLGAWQPIARTLPPARETLLLAIEGGGVTTGDFWPGLGWSWDETDDEPEDAKPTHWMRMPRHPVSA